MTLDERNLVDDIIMNVRIAADAIGLTDGAVAVWMATTASMSRVPWSATVTASR